MGTREAVEKGPCFAEIEIEWEVWRFHPPVHSRGTETRVAAYAGKRNHWVSTGCPLLQELVTQKNCLRSLSKRTALRPSTGTKVKTPKNWTESAEAAESESEAGEQPDHVQGPGLQLRGGGVRAPETSAPSRRRRVATCGWLGEVSPHS